MQSLEVEHPKNPQTQFCDVTCMKKEVPVPDPPEKDFIFQNAARAQERPEATFAETYKLIKIQ